MNYITIIKDNGVRGFGMVVVDNENRTITIGVGVIRGRGIDNMYLLINGKLIALTPSVLYCESDRQGVLEWGLVTTKICQCNICRKEYSTVDYYYKNTSLTSNNMILLKELTK